MARGKRARRLQSRRLMDEMKTVEGQVDGPTICLFADHYPEDAEVKSALFVIPLPLDLSEHDEDMTTDISDSNQNNITILPFSIKDTLMFNRGTVLVNIGSKIYFFGGSPYFIYDTLPFPEVMNMYLRLQVVDLNEPEPKLRSLAPMHTSKEFPCVFVADGFIYALAFDPFGSVRKLAGFEHTGCFERYIPFKNCWQVLPDPPFLHMWGSPQLCDSATVIGRRVIIGYSSKYAIFCLDSLIWETDNFPPQPAPYFPFGSFFVQQSQSQSAPSSSLYHLIGQGISKRLNSTFDLSPFNVPDIAVMRHPLPPAAVELSGSVLVDHCYQYAEEVQIMADATVLDGDKTFTKPNYSPERFFFHVGGRFFCYVVTAQLVDHLNKTQYEPCSRGVLIKFFEEEDTDTNSSTSGTVFRLVASFCYKINTAFPNFTGVTRCSVIGAVPDNWISAPPKKRQESKPKPVSIGTRIEGEAAQTRRHEPEKTNENETEDLKKHLEAREEEIRILIAELVKKNAELAKKNENTSIQELVKAVWPL